MEGHAAMAHGHLPVCRLIVMNVEDKNPEDEIGETPYDHALLKKHTAVSDFLLETTKSEPE